VVDGDTTKRKRADGPALQTSYSLGPEYKTPYLGSSRLHTTSKGLALKIDEYVPLTIPMRSASVKPLMFCGEIKKRATRTKTTVIEVLTDRARD
jgi:hypothetical protein